METVCLENFWSDRLVSLGWSVPACKWFQFAWAESTKRSYNIVLNKLLVFCDTKGFSFPPESSAHIADFLCWLGSQSSKPASQLNTACAAIGHLYESIGTKNLMQTSEIKLLIQGLIKAGTEAPMRISKVMPVEAFCELFSSWSENEGLTIKELRLKAVTLLALTVMLRPSDIAPKSVIYQADCDTVRRSVFSTDHISITNDGSVKLCFFGIKNDTRRQGFTVTLPKAADVKVDPVSALSSYIERTDVYRKDIPGKPVFISLSTPYRALTSGSIADVLSEAIKKAGLDSQGFTPRDFRPSGATTAIDQGINPDIVMAVGRWKTADVFYKHYVHSKTPVDFTNKVLKQTVD